MTVQGRLRDVKRDQLYDGFARVCTHKVSSICWPCSEIGEKGSRWWQIKRERWNKKHRESTRTPLRLNLVLSNTPTRLICYLIQASWMCDGPKKNRYTENPATVLYVFNIRAHLQLYANRPWQILFSRLLKRIERMIVCCSPATKREKQGSSSQSQAMWAVTQKHGYETLGGWGSDR